MREKYLIHFKLV